MIQVNSVYPGNEDLFPVDQSIEIMFDGYLDPDCIESGIVLSGPEGQVYIGPWFEEHLQYVNDKYPAYNASLTSPRDISMDCQVSYYDDEDLLESKPTVFSSDGKTLVKLRPKSPWFFRANSEYKLTICGESVTGGEPGIVATELSVYRPIVLGTHLGNGSLQSYGNYVGDNTSLLIEVTRSGTSYDCSFTVLVQSTGELKTFNINENNNQAFYSIEVVDGVYVTLIGSQIGSFEEGDQWIINLRDALMLEESYSIVFKTLGSTVVPLPNSLASTSPIDVRGEETIPEGLKVLSIEPENSKSNVSTTGKKIVVTFNKNLDETKLTSDSVRISKSFVNSPDFKDVPHRVFVDGNKLIIILGES
jgi:hypothetical protein